MILRILAILGAVAAAVMFFVIGNTKQQLEEDLQFTERELSRTANALSSMTEERDELTQQVSQLTNDLEESTARAMNLDDQLIRVRQELAAANRLIATRESEADSLRAEANQIRRALLEERQRIEALESGRGDISDDARATIQALERQLLETEQRLQGIDHTEIATEDRRDQFRTRLIRGSVINVDSNGSYIIIDKGSDEGVRSNSAVMIRRGPNFIARGNIREVHEGLSIAEVLPGSEPIIPGDLVTTLN